MMGSSKEIPTGKEVNPINNRHKKAVWLTACVIFLIFCGAVGWFVGKPLIALADNPEQFREWVDSYGAWGKVIFVGMVALQVVVAMIPGEPLELMGGYAFGALEGTILTLIGILIGSALVFLLVRRFGVKLVEVFFSSDKIQEMAFLQNPEKTKIIAFVLMMIPGTPKDFLSYFAGLTRLTLKQWLMIVMVARIPSVIGSTISGGAAGEANYILAAVMLILTLALSGVGVYYYRRICRQQQEEFEDVELPNAS